MGMLLASLPLEGVVNLHCHITHFLTWTGLHFRLFDWLSESVAASPVSSLVQVSQMFQQVTTIWVTISSFATMGALWLIPCFFVKLDSVLAGEQWVFSCLVQLHQLAFVHLFFQRGWLCLQHVQFRLVGIVDNQVPKMGNPITKI